MTSRAEMTLAAQLEVARIHFVREFRFHPDRKFRADFMVGLDLLVEVDGGTWVEGRHNRGSSIAAEYEKGALAAIRGYRVIHATSEQVADGTCLRWILEALRSSKEEAA